MYVIFYLLQVPPVKAASQVLSVALERLGHRGLADLLEQQVKQASQDHAVMQALRDLKAHWVRLEFPDSWVSKDHVVNLEYQVSLVSVDHLDGPAFREFSDPRDRLDHKA